MPKEKKNKPKLGRAEFSGAEQIGGDGHGDGDGKKRINWR